MMTAVRLSLATVVVAVMSVADAALKVEETDSGVFNVVKDGVAVATGFSPVLDRDVSMKRSFIVSKDGSRVWNLWNECHDDNFRFEMVERADGAVEVSILGYSVKKTVNRRRALSFGMPGNVFAGRPYKAKNKHRLYAADSKGVFSAEMTPFETRYYSSAGIVFNCDPGTPGVYTNPGSRHGVCGVWSVKPDGKGGFVASSYAMLPKDGNGEAGLKIVIHEGTYADYSKDHLLSSFNIYYDRFVPLHLVKFGAPKAGTDYKDGNCLFESRFGWVGAHKQQVRVGNPTGAYYSHAYGSGKSVYRFAQLHPGYYILTCQLGNYTGERNRFSITVNGEMLATDVSVGAKEARTISRTFHVDGSSLDIVFDGDWLVSGIGLQPLLSDEEDWFMRRGFWFSDGFEPSLARRNSYSRPFRPATFDQTIAMPEPGKEVSRMRRSPPRPVELVDMSKPENQWMYELKMRNVDLGVNGVALSNVVRRKEYIDESVSMRYNAFMLAGVRCPHLDAPEVRRIDDAQRVMFVKSAHDRGLKFVDHIDITLGWANRYGFRSLIEQLDKTMLDVNVNLPTYLFCPENPGWKQKFYAYLRRMVECGADGFQLDELTYWRHGCGCAHCRIKFADETGWIFPLDEVSPSVRASENTELSRCWKEWQRVNIANWRVGLRRFVKDINPNLYMSLYGTYGNQVGGGSLDGFMENARVLSMVGTEVMQQDVMRCARPLMALARLKNVVRLAYGTPAWNWYYNSNYANECFAFAVSSMTGEVPLLTGASLGAVYDPAFANPVEWSAKSRPMKIAGAYPLAEVGLLFSRASRRYNEGKGLAPEIMGLAQELESMHVPYEFFTDDSCVFEHLRKYKVVFLGDSQCLSDAVVCALNTYRMRGGRVYGQPNCGTRDEVGCMRKNPIEICLSMPSAAAFYEPENPVRGKDATQWKCDPAKEAAFRRKVAAYIGDAAWWRVEGAPDKVYTSVFREASGDIVVHFLNATGCDLWENGQFVRLKSKARYPALKDDIFFEVPRSVGSVAFALSPDFGVEERRLEKVSASSGRLRFRLPKEFLSVYTIVRFAWD